MNVPDRGPDSVIRNGYGFPMPPPPPFVIDWSQWGEACRYLARRIRWKAELDERAFTEIWPGLGPGRILAHTLAEMTGIPIVRAADRTTRSIYCTGIHAALAEYAGPDAIEVSVVTYHHPAPVGAQWYFALAPGRRVIWPWQV